MRPGLFIIASFLMLVSCTRPESENLFVKASDSDDGLYEFKVDLSDPGEDGYDFAFYTRVDDISLKSKYGTIPLDICWMSPSSRRALEERVYIGRGDLGGLSAEYRSAVRPSETGVWTLYVRPVDPPKGFRGLGLTVKRNGTR